MRSELSTARKTLTRCLVCGFAEVRTDEVIDRGTVFLAECPRCEHRWTSAEAPRPSLAVRTPAHAREEVASAA